MTQIEQIEIPLSKKKMLLAFLGAIVFVGLGVLFLIHPSMLSSSIFYNPAIIIITGLASVLFFGLVAITIFRKTAYPLRSSGLFLLIFSAFTTPISIACCISR